MTNIKVITNYLDEIYKEPICELNYNLDYELLIATVLSAQSTDKRVNQVTQILFNKYNIYDLAKLDIDIIKEIIKPVGTFNKKAIYIKEISEKLINDYQGKVPNNRSYLESLPGVGRKTTNVVLGELYQVPTIAVDTHVSRVSKRLNLVKEKDNVLQTEKKLMKLIPKEDWIKFHHQLVLFGRYNQLVLFGRYNCKSIKPNCNICKLKNICKKP